MPSGDVRQWRGRGGGGGGSYSYDDEGRGGSKDVWEWFEHNYTFHEFADVWLETLSDEACYRLVHMSTTRFNLEDITGYPWHEEEHRERIYNEQPRASRLISQKSPHKRDMWYDFHRHIVEGYLREKARLEEQRRKEYEHSQRGWEETRIAREAEVAKLHDELAAKVNNIIELTAGNLRSDFDAAFAMEEIHYQRSGDYLEDVTEGYISGSGFAEETKRPSGIKLQVTLSMDLSNSMHYNRIDDIAVKAFFEVGIALKQMYIEHPDDLYVAFFGFSDRSDGKLAGRFMASGGMYAANSWYASREDINQNVTKKLLGDGFNAFELNQFTGYQYTGGLFTGEDTWISPLFEQIEQWENVNGDPTAARIDIIITDAVLEHVTDIRKANDIQDHRNGNLQTVLLNFMPEKEWSTGTLPHRCVQYHASADNISGLLRQIIHDFISINM